ncbi:MAG: hypothetical protein ABSB41_06580 [Anaerolineales bacterium]|jgi:hypothetical protein
MIKFFRDLKTSSWLAVVILVAATERFLLYIFYRPVSYNDTATYRRLAGQVAQGWDHFEASRMPGYPFFLSLVGPDEHVYTVQLVLGFLTSLLFFYIGWRVTGKGWFAGLAALAHTLNLQQLFIEADLLTEPLTTFFIALALAGMAWLLFSEEKPPLWRILLAGLLVGSSSGLAILMRANYLFLPFWAAFLVIIGWRVGPPLRWAAGAAIGLVGLVVVGVWINYVHQDYHMWSLSTVDGYHLMNHSGVFFEYVPDQYAAVRDTFLQYRAAQIAQTGSPGNTIWNAIPALEKASGLGFFDLSRLLEKISIQLILKYPGLYLRDVFLGWEAFWKAPFHWEVSPGENPSLAILRGGIVLLDRGILILANLVFILGTLLLAWKRARRFLKMDTFWWFVLSVIWLTSVIQALLEYGDNPRYSVSVQSWIILIVLWWVIQILNTTIRKKV